MKKDFTLNMITTLLALMFLYASFSKYADFERYTAAMHRQPFPGWLTMLLIWSLPPLEIFIVIGLFTGMFYKKILAGLYAFLLVMLVFTVYIAAILLHLFPKVPCSCGGIIQRLSWGQHLIFNLFFIVLALIAIRLKKENIKTMPLY